MTILFVAVAAIVMMSFPATRPVHPGAAALLVGESIDGVECRPSAGTGSVLEQSAPNRASNFSAVGEYTCHRSVFTADERDVLVERLIRSEGAKAKRVASAVHSHLSRARALPKDDQSKSPAAPLRLRVRGTNDPELSDLVAKLYRVELSSALPSGAVSHMPAGPDDSPVLDIELRRVDSPDAMTKVVLLSQTKKGKKSWHEF